MKRIPKSVIFVVVGAALVAAPAVAIVSNAHKVDGLHAAQIQSKVKTQSDGNSDFTTGASASDASPLTINTVNLKAPRAGQFVISGNVVIANGSDYSGDPHTGLLYTLFPTVNGSRPAGQDEAMEGVVATSTSSALAYFDLAYTVTVPVDKGDYTVRQRIGASKNAGFAYNSQNLSVLFVPNGTPSHS